MRSSIARGALALISVAAIAGCQSGSHWDPKWYNPFNYDTTAPATTSSVASAPQRPASLATAPPSGSYGGGTTANPYSPYSSSGTARAPGYDTAPNPYSGGGNNSTASNPYASPTVSTGFPTGSASTQASPYGSPSTSAPTSPYVASPYSSGGAAAQYPSVASNVSPYGTNSTPVGSYPQTSTPYAQPAATASPGGVPCTGNACPVPGAAAGPATDAVGPGADMDASGPGRQRLWRMVRRVRRRDVCQLQYDSSAGVWFRSRVGLRHGIHSELQ